MRWKIFFTFIFILIVILLLVFYLFPFKTIEFIMPNENTNFSLKGEGMQFYPNMRFPSSKISYKIYDCTLQKINDMERAFDIISDGSRVGFYRVEDDEEISVNCDSYDKMKEGLFIAGEGGPSNVTLAGNFYVILHGDILLIRNSRCDTPNVAIHELLHVLGFNHSTNPNNVMYPVTKCGQTIGDDVFDLIDELYLTPSYPDLSFENVSAIMHGRYLDIDMIIKNNGLADCEESKVMIYADGNFIKEIDVGFLKIGYGRVITLQNLWVSQLNVNELEFLIEYNLSELEKNNNKIVLEIKKK